MQFNARRRARPPAADPNAQAVFECCLNKIAAATVESWIPLAAGVHSEAMARRMAEARTVLDAWRLEYNHRRPHSGIGWQTPAAFAATMDAATATLDEQTAGAFPAARPAGLSVGAPPLPPGRPANHHPILS